ncbi:MAG: peptidoglycan DD-metalloendopeptidase family protein [Hyphomonadaceae bacterium]
MKSSFVLHELRRAWRGVAAGAALAVAAGSGLAWAGAQGLLGGPAAAAKESGGLEELRIAAAKRAELLAFTEPYLKQNACEFTVARGETFAGLLLRAGATPRDANAAIASIRDVFNPRALRPGQPVRLVFTRAPAAGQTLSGVSFRSEPGASIAASRTPAGQFAARQVQMPLTFEIARIAAPVRDSLYESALRLGATDREISALADAFSYDVDFQRDLRADDTFELVFERFYDDQGATVRTGELLFVALETRDGPRHFYRFQAPGDAHADWYDEEGKSARKFLMKTPVNGAHLASGFGMRLHPILGFSMMHRGVDFGAPIGTPVMAAGDGVIERAGPFSTYGNYVRIRHSAGYETAYAHLSRFAPRVRAGQRVRQGQIIGYVGMSGRSTGPHLHYEVLRGGAQINPMSLRVATGRNLSGHDLQLFVAERARIDTLRQARARENDLTLASAAAEAQAR